MIRAALAVIGAAGAATLITGCGSSHVVTRTVTSVVTVSAAPGPATSTPAAARTSAQIPDPHAATLSPIVLAQTIEDQSADAGGYVTGVICPSGQPVQKGWTFQCSAADGIHLTVTVQDTQGRFTWVRTGAH